MSFGKPLLESVGKYSWTYWFLHGHSDLLVDLEKVGITEKDGVNDYCSMNM